MIKCIFVNIFRSASNYSTKSGKNDMEKQCKVSKNFS